MLQGAQPTEKHGDTCRGYDVTSVHLGNSDGYKGPCGTQEAREGMEWMPWPQTQNLSQTPSLERLLRALRDETVVPWAPSGLIPKTSTS